MKELISTMKELIIAILTKILGALLTLLLFPLATIWALNALFPILQIQYSVSTWLAAIVLLLFFRSKR